MSVINSNFDSSVIPMQKKKKAKKFKYQGFNNRYLIFKFALYIGKAEKGNLENFENRKKEKYQYQKKIFLKSFFKYYDNL